eukprot:1747984-Pleurochrysis_carterae.AAC.1
MVGTALLLIPGDEADYFGKPTGAVLFGITQVINMNYAWYELRELYANGWEYFSSAQNICDLASIANVLALVPLIAVQDVNANGAAAIGTVLLIPKMASIARGAEKYSFLVSMLVECIKDMVPFLRRAPSSRDARMLVRQSFQGAAAVLAIAGNDYSRVARFVHFAAGAVSARGLACFSVIVANCFLNLS